MAEMISEIERLKRLHAGAERELSMLVGRSFLTPREELEARNLKKLELRLEDRIAWIEAMLRRQEAA